MARKVRVAAFTDMCPKKPREVPDNLDWTCETLDLVAYEKPDIVCLTETFDTFHPEAIAAIRSELEEIGML